MFLIEPFIWMFSVKNFKHHFMYLLLTAAICWFSTFLLFFFSERLFSFNSLIINIIVIVSGIFLFLAPFLALTGYFWCLTDNIIGREQEAKLNSIYSGDKGLKNIITLPEWDLPRFIWRGIASIVASIIMYIPFTIIVVLIIFNLSVIAAFWQLDPMQVTIATFIIMILMALLLPGLLWNYARRDSVVAVLNIPKAIDLLANNASRYLLHTILLIIVYVISSLITSFLSTISGFSENMHALPDATIFTAIKVIFVLLCCHIINIYFIYVYAYVLGTLVPTNEH